MTVLVGVAAVRRTMAGYGKETNMKAAKVLALGAGLGCLVLLTGCNNKLFNRLKPHAYLYYYNQITSQGAPDQTALTTRFTVTSHGGGDSVASQGYSQGSDASELSVSLDSTDQKNGVTLSGDSRTGASLFSTQVALTKDASYLAVSYGDTTTGSVGVGVYAQDQSSVSSGKARFRVIDTVSSNILGILGLDLELSGQNTPFASDETLGDVTDYQTVDSGTLRIKVYQHGASPPRLIDTVSCTLRAGKSYDAILTAKDPLNPPTDPANASGALALYCHRQAVP